MDLPQAPDPQIPKVLNVLEAKTHLEEATVQIIM